MRIETPHLLTNYPRGDKVRLAQAELFLEFCSYAGFPTYAAESSPEWPGQEGLWVTETPTKRGSLSSAWRWTDQVPQDPNHPFFKNGRNYV